MQEKNDILNLKVSFQENTWTNVSAIEPTIKSVLEDIQSDKYKQQVTDLRNNLNSGNTDYYNENKKRLPAVTFSATFNTNRTRENVKTYNSLIVIDIDKLEENQIVKCYDILLKDNYVFTFWRSPSNNGFKGLVQLEFADIAPEIDLDTKHKSAFKKLSTYFQNTYELELDKSGSDISRLCFLSYDTQLVKKEIFSTFQVNNEDVIVALPKGTNGRTKQIKFVSNKDALFNPFERNNQYDRKLMSDIIRYLTNKNKSITFSYAGWCKVAMAIANTFTYDVGLNYFLKLSKLDGTKFNEVHCTNFLINCYETRNGAVNFASIIHLANEKGYKTKQQKLKILEGVLKTEG
ncbi:MAG: hypothetical protein MUF43_14755 [Flavobacterium sp.]|nr:hypothetical protein [Flavobacterium sp.]